MEAAPARHVGSDDVGRRYGHKPVVERDGKAVVRQGHLEQGRLAEEVVP